MIENMKTIVRNKIALLPMSGAILIIISFFTPFAISEGVEGISLSSQSNVWYWGIYQEQDQVFSLNIPFSLNIFLPIIILALAILILVLSIEYGLNNVKRKLFGELLFIFIVVIYLSMSLTVRLIEYAFSIMPDLVEIFPGRYAPFWGYRDPGFGNFGIGLAIFLVVVGSLISLAKSRKSFFYIEISIISVWFISNLTILYFLF